MENQHINLYFKEEYDSRVAIISPAIEYMRNIHRKYRDFVINIALSGQVASWLIGRVDEFKDIDFLVNTVGDCNILIRKLCGKLKFVFKQHNIHETGQIFEKKFPELCCKIRLNVSWCSEWYTGVYRNFYNMYENCNNQNYFLLKSKQWYGIYPYTYGLILSNISPQYDVFYSGECYCKYVKNHSSLICNEYLMYHLNSNIYATSIHKRKIRKNLKYFIKSKKIPHKFNFFKVTCEKCIDRNRNIEMKFFSLWLHHTYRIGSTIYNEAKKRFEEIQDPKSAFEH